MKLKTYLHTPYISQFEVVPKPSSSSADQGSRPNENTPDATSSTPSRPRRGISTKKWLSAFFKCARPQTTEETRSKATEECSSQNESLQLINKHGAWFHCVTMLAQHFEEGPRLGIPELYKENRFLPLRGDALQQLFAFQELQEKGYENAHIALLKRENLRTVARCGNTNVKYTRDYLEFLLNRSGPIMFFWNKQREQTGETYSHASVIVGVDEEKNEIIYHDPEGRGDADNARDARMSIDEFNERRQKVQFGMLQRQGALERYPNHKDFLANEQPDYSTPEARQGSIFYLETPYLSQNNFGADDSNPTGMNDRTGCWYTSAAMLGAFFEEGPRLGVPHLYKDGEGHSNFNARALPAFMENEQLEEVPGSKGNQHFSIEQLEDLLKAGGPILFSWEKVRRSNNVTIRHMCVVVGVDKDRQRVIYHDPETRERGERSANASMSIEQFNIARDVRPRLPLLQRSREAILSSRKFSNHPASTAIEEQAPNQREISGIAEEKELQQSRAESSRARQNRMRFFTEEAELKGHLLRSNIVQNVYRPKPLLQRSPETILPSQKSSNHPASAAIEEQAQNQHASSGIAEEKEPRQSRVESNRTRRNRIKFFKERAELNGHLFR